MANKSTLLVLDQTEHAAIVEALTHYTEHPFLGDGNWVSVEAREKFRQPLIQFLKELQSFQGGFRKRILEGLLFELQDALLWYGSFFPRRDQVNFYADLAGIVIQRNQHIHLFKDFEPTTYNCNDNESIEKIAFAKPRLLTIRLNQGEVDIVREFHQYNKEDPDDYYQRGLQNVEHQNKFYQDEDEKTQRSTFKNMSWKLIWYSDLSNFTIGDSCHYSSRNKN